MEIATDTAKQMRDEELFKAAEWGDSSLFMSLSEEQLSKSLNFRNEDGRSLLHVAASFGHSQVCSFLFSIILRTNLWLDNLFDYYSCSK
jgi:26S proteasome non-ATPase regulatory subunit 10